jgi:hypothetical protein
LGGSYADTGGLRRIADEVAREWQQIRLRERMDWLYNHDATAIAI